MRLYKAAFENFLKTENCRQFLMRLPMTRFSNRNSVLPTVLILTTFFTCGCHFEYKSTPSSSKTVSSSTTVSSAGSDVSSSRTVSSSGSYSSETTSGDTRERTWGQTKDLLEKTIRATGQVKFVHGKIAEMAPDSLVTLTEKEGNREKVAEFRPGMKLFIKVGDKFMPATKEDEFWAEQLLISFNINDPEPPNLFTLPPGQLK